MAVVTLAAAAQIAVTVSADMHSPVQFSAAPSIKFNVAPDLTGVWLLSASPTIDFDFSGVGLISRKIAQAQQSLSPGDRVELFEIDGGPIGATTQRFVAGTLGGSAVRYDGATYAPTPVEATGFEWNGRGPMPTPRLKIANVTNILSGLALQYDDLVGADVRRIVTFTKFLDNGSEPDATAHFPIDEFRIERKVAANNVFIEFELASAVDQEGVKLPRRQILKDVCLWRYRAYDAKAGQFDYTDVVGCPYTGSAYYDETGAPATAATDRCGKRLSDCKLRFGATAELPFGGFPGVTRQRR